MTTRLRLGKHETQGRLYSLKMSPRPAPEKDLVNAIRRGLTKMGVLNWSGRIHVRNHRPPYLPILGPGTPDILWLAGGKFGGIEVKRGDVKAKPDPAQWSWHAVAQFHGMHVITVNDVRSALDAVREARGG